jgi:hypothetical protein
MCLSVPVEVIDIGKKTQAYYIFVHVSQGWPQDTGYFKKGSYFLNIFDMLRFYGHF